MALDKDQKQFLKNVFEGALKRYPARTLFNTLADAGVPTEWDGNNVTITHPRTQKQLIFAATPKKQWSTSTLNRSPELKDAVRTVLINQCDYRPSDIDERAPGWRGLPGYH